MSGRAVLAIVIAAASVPAQEPGVLRRIDGTESTGQLIGASGESLTMRVAGETVSVPLDDCEEYLPVTSDPVADDRAGRVWLRSGREYPASIYGRADGAWEITLPAAEPIGISSRHIAALRLQTTRDEDGGFERALESPRATGDRLFAWTRDGSRIVQFSTVVQSVGRDGITVLNDGAPAELPIDRVYGVVFATEHGASPPRLPRPTVTVEVAHGTGEPVAYGGRLEAVAAGVIRLRLAEGAILAVRADALVRLRIESSAVLPLARAEPVEVRQTPAFDRVRPWLRDASPNGPGLVLGTTTYRRGYCIVPRTTMVFDVPAGFEVFETTIGIDARTSRHAHAVFRVRADGEVVFESPPMTLDSEPIHVELRIDAAARIALETDFGKNFDLSDHCVFAEPRLRRR